MNAQTIKEEIKKLNQEALQLCYSIAASQLRANIQTLEDSIKPDCDCDQQPGEAA